VTAVAKAAAEAACPDGNEVVTGVRRTRRTSRNRLTAGRLRRESSLASTFDVALAIATPVTPRTAPRRAAGGPVTSSTAAIPSHSAEKFAASPSGGSTRSSSTEAVAATRSIIR
jgi:hypothetical protein